MAVQLQLLQPRAPQRLQPDALHQRLEAHARDGAKDGGLRGGEGVGCRGGWGWGWTFKVERRGPGGGGAYLADLTNVTWAAATCASSSFPNDSTRRYHG